MPREGTTKPSVRKGFLRIPVTSWLAIVAVAALGMATWQGSPRRVEPISGVGQVPLFTFVSMPDFLNTDIGDTRLRAGKGWDPGDPVSTNKSWSAALDTILDEVKAEDPAVVLVAGDLVEGHWGVDVRKTGIFGPVGTPEERLAAISNAADLYYSAWLKRFQDRELRVLPAVGDHELGDNPWRVGSFKLDAVPTYKRVWAEKFTRTPTGHRFARRPVGTPFEDTAYAVRIANTMFVTVDVFRPTQQGVRLTVDGGQLRWLDKVLGNARRSGVEHIVVQGHIPVLPDVRRRHSSALTMPGGAETLFWETLDRHDVDLYLAGEMHDMTTLTRDGIVQVVHGGLAIYGQVNYLVGRVYADRIELQLKAFHGVVTDNHRMWNTSYKRPTRGVSYAGGAHPVGSMVIDKSRGRTVLGARTGRLRDGM